MLYLLCCNRVTREFSSVGRVPALQAEGHRFESYNSHHSDCILLNKSKFIGFPQELMFAVGRGANEQRLMFANSKEV